MNRSEYNSYLASVEAFYGAEDIDGLTDSGRSTEYFSKSPCDCCRRPEHGTRVDMVGYRVGRGTLPAIPYTYSVCVDCEYFAEYGRLDDATMIALDD